jgi:hypothetical protein
MSSFTNRITIKNEATGLRLVSQVVQEYWECGWQPFEHRNDKGIDGLILLRKKGRDLGLRLNVQVKCGQGYISSTDNEYIYISIHDSKSLLTHLDYWKNQSEPVVLIFVNPFIKSRDINGNVLVDLDGSTIWKENRLTPKAWWVDLKVSDLLKENTRTIIKVHKSNRFGEHSKGDLVRLAQKAMSNVGLQKIQPQMASVAILNSMDLTKEAKQFYKDWRLNDTTCKATNENVIISRTGWRHILHSRRTKERRLTSLRYLGFAKDIIENAEDSFLLTQTEDYNQTEQKIGLRAIILTKNNGNISVQVILLRRVNTNTGVSRCWFYSVHNR